MTDSLEKPTKSDTSRRRRPSRWLTQMIALSLALIALLVACTVLVTRGALTNQDAQRQAAISAATAVTRDLSSISASNAPQHMDSLTKQSTGEFHDQLGAYSAIFEKILQTGNVKSDATVTAAGIERMDEHDATVLVTVASLVSNSQMSAAQPRFYRLSVQLQHLGGMWLASKVVYVG